MIANRTTVSAARQELAAINTKLNELINLLETYISALSSEEQLHLSAQEEQTASIVSKRQQIASLTEKISRVRKQASGLKTKKV